jgi:membrane protein DedA with SNARE-associated domain/uncharacterized tellurite resistance protein B-like protein
MMERFVAWLAELSPLTVYLVIGLSTLVENVFPPTPSDVAVALGGFLTQHTAISPVAVWLTAWLPNLGGSIVVYGLTRRHGRRFLASRLGQRLLPGDAIVAMERGYLRFGVAGIVIARVLPGFRSFVAPFVGLMGQPAVRALLPITVASGIWYAFLTWVGVRLGAEWGAISRFLGHLNRTLAVVSIVAAAALGYWLWQRQRGQGPRRSRLLRIVRVALGDQVGEAAEAPGEDAAVHSAAALLHELTQADPGFTPDERAAIADYLRTCWNGASDIDDSERHPLATMADTGELTVLVTEVYDQARRVALAARLYRIALNDGTLSRHEERLMARAGGLLGLRPEDLARARAAGRSSPETTDSTAVQAGPPDCAPSGS